MTSHRNVSYMSLIANAVVSLLLRLEARIWKALFEFTSRCPQCLLSWEPTSIPWQEFQSGNQEEHQIRTFGIVFHSHIPSTTAYCYGLLCGISSWASLVFYFRLLHRSRDIRFWHSMMLWWNQLGVHWDVAPTWEEVPLHRPNLSRLHCRRSTLHHDRA